MLDWLGKMLELPKEFLASSGGKGGGVIQVHMNMPLSYGWISTCNSSSVKSYFTCSGFLHFSNS
jgi:hypothetical protein